MVSTGILSIGKSIENKTTYNLIGNISHLNLWSWAISGRDIEEIAKNPGSRDGDLIAWFRVKDYAKDAMTVRPSTASFSGSLRRKQMFLSKYDICLPMLGHGQNDGHH